ncbi:hypothetical protein CLOP_g11100 [Closterium sp. NIES-67]|nr:hypothetical protein CLOP_g11100 [Closterium sp. NIES-67]
MPGAVVKVPVTCCFPAASRTSRIRLSPSAGRLSNNRHLTIRLHQPPGGSESVRVKEQTGWSAGSCLGRRRVGVSAFLRRKQLEGTAIHLPLAQDSQELLLLVVGTLPKGKHLGGGVGRRRGAVVIPAATANANVACGTGREKAGRDAIRRGMQLFIENEVEASLAEFEAALELDPSQIPYLWQRGLSLFYLNRFAEASQQFRACIAANSRDAEESIWYFVSEARANGADSARESMPEVPRDPGKVLRAAYDMFKSGADPLQVLAAAGDDEGGSSAFYARLYVGLFFEIMGDEQQAGNTCNQQQQQNTHADLQTTWQQWHGCIACDDNGHYRSLL